MSRGKPIAGGAGELRRGNAEALGRLGRREKRPVLSPAQCRAARAILGWTQAELARLATLARKTIADFEAHGRALQFRSRRDITAAFEAAGIEFIWADACEGRGGSAATATEGLRFSPSLAARPGKREDD